MCSLCNTVQLPGLHFCAKQTVFMLLVLIYFDGYTSKDESVNSITKIIIQFFRYWTNE